VTSSTVNEGEESRVNYSEEGRGEGETISRFRRNRVSVLHSEGLGERVRRGEGIGGKRKGARRREKEERE